MSCYYEDDQKVSLSAFQARLEATDLIPSQESLLPHLPVLIPLLNAEGLDTLAKLRKALKSKKSLQSLACRIGWDEKPLALLRRTVESYFPKPIALAEFSQLDPQMLKALQKAGIQHTRQLFEGYWRDPASFCTSCGFSTEALGEALALADLCRIQWVGVTVARMLLAAGTSSSHAVAHAACDTLHDALQEANREHGLMKGSIGKRDVARLIHAASTPPPVG